MKICINPACKREFEPGHYGDLQLVCTGTYVSKCSRCKGKECRRCGGKGTYRRACRDWYREYYAATRRPPKAIPDLEFDKIAAEAKKEDLRKWALILLVRASGLRKGEALGLTWADLVDDGKIRTVVTVRGQWDDVRGFVAPKVGEGKVAVIPSDEARSAVLKVWAGARDEKPTDRAFPYWESGVWSWFTGIQERLGIADPETKRPYPFHSLRHTAAIRTIRAGGSLKDAADLLGHKSLQTTRIYTQERPEEFAARMEKALKRKK